MNRASHPKTGAAGLDLRRGITAAHLLSLTSLLLLGLTGLRTRTHTYVEHEGGDRELYGTREDPHHLDNLHDRSDEKLLKELEGCLDDLEDCAGARCREAEE